MSLAEDQERRFDRLEEEANKRIEKSLALLERQVVALEAIAEALRDQDFIGPDEGDRPE